MVPAIFMAPHVKFCPLNFLLTLYFKVDVTVNLFVGDSCLDMLVEFAVMLVRFCPWNQYIVAAGRLPVDIHMTSRYFAVSSVLKMSDAKGVTIGLAVKKEKIIWTIFSGI